MIDLIKIIFKNVSVVPQKVLNHLVNTTIHVTQNDKDTWNGFNATLDGLVDDATFNSAVTSLQSADTTSAGNITTVNNTLTLHATNGFTDQKHLTDAKLTLVNAIEQAFTNSLKTKYDNYDSAIKLNAVKSDFQIPDSGYSLNGTTNYFSAVNTSIFNLATADFSLIITFSGLTAPIVDSNSLYAFIHKLSGSNGFNFMIRGGVYNGLTFGMGNGTGVLSINASSDISATLRDGKLHQIIVTRTAAVGSAYLDGNLIAVTGSLTAEYVDSGINTTIGRYAGSSGGYFPGKIHNIMMLDHVVIASEALKLWNNGLQQNIQIPAGALLVLGNSAGNYTWADLTQNLNNFTNVGCTTLRKELRTIAHKQAITGDTVLTGGVASKYLCLQSKFKNTTANSVTIKLGTTAGGVEINSALVIPANTTIYLAISKIFSESADQNIYISSASWSSASLNITLINLKAE